ncbi:Diacylglycerol O-acyltransferase 2D, partial [Mucuna pruriens]
MEKVFKGVEEFSESRNMFKKVLALVLYLGAIHFNLALIIFATFFLPLSKALMLVLINCLFFIFMFRFCNLFIMVFGFLLVFIMIPVNENSMFGRKLSKYICKHICSYFPITLHIEEAKAFRPNHAYAL